MRKKRGVGRGAAPAPADIERLVILVDDLDRLHPDIAVELLETIKLFLDVEQCVYVLAIDYDVVMQGVRSKYDEGMPEEKCRSFFDKIIQLPFSMPVETYKLDDMVKKYLGEKMEKNDIAKVSSFATAVVGANPRTLKRVANAFLLLEIVQEKRAQGEKGKSQEAVYRDNALLFCVLCIQIRYPLLYSYLSDTENWLKDEKKEGLLSLSVSDDEDATLEAVKNAVSKYSAGEPEARQLSQMANALDKLEETLGSVCGSGNAERYENLARVIGLSATTSRENAAQQVKGSRSTPVAITIDGERKEYGQAQEAFGAAVEELLQKNPGRIGECVSTFKNFLTTDKKDEGSYFYYGPSGKHFTRKLDGVFHEEDGHEKPLYVGVRTNNATKRSMLGKLCKYLDMKEGAVLWEESGKTYDLSK